MNITKWILSLLKICPSANIRPTLAWLFFRKNKVAVTDSFKLIELTLKDTRVGDVLINFEKLQESEIEEGFIIPEKTLKKIKLPKTKMEEFDLAYIGNLKKDQAWMIQTIDIKTRDWDNEISISSWVLKWKFPDYESFFLSEVNLRVWLDIYNVIDTLKTYEANWIRSVVFKLKWWLDPVEIEWENEKVSIRSIIMPLKI